MIFNPKRQVAETGQKMPAPHVPQLHMQGPPVKSSENQGLPQALTGQNQGTHAAKTGTHAEQGTPDSAQGNQQNPPSDAHGRVVFNSVLTIGDPKLAAAVQGVAETWRARVRQEVANAPGDWVVSPAFTRTLIEARKALDEAVQLHHGATRVLVSKPGDQPRLYEVRGPLRPHEPEAIAADMLAADLQYMLVVQAAAETAKAADRPREYRWINEHYVTWCLLLDSHFAPLRDELLQVANRYTAACEKWEAGFAPEKEAKNVAAISALLERMATLHEHFWTYRPAYLPAQYFAKRTWSPVQ